MPEKKTTSGANAAATGSKKNAGPSNVKAGDNSRAGQPAPTNAVPKAPTLHLLSEQWYAYKNNIVVLKPDIAKKAPASQCFMNAGCKEHIVVLLSARRRNREEYADEEHVMWQPKDWERQELTEPRTKIWLNVHTKTGSRIVLQLPNQGLGALVKLAHRLLDMGATDLVEWADQKGVQRVNMSVLGPARNTRTGGCAEYHSTALSSTEDLTKTGGARAYESESSAPPSGAVTPSQASSSSGFSSFSESEAGFAYRPRPSNMSTHEHVSKSSIGLSKVGDQSFASLMSQSSTSVAYRPQFPKKSTNERPPKSSAGLSEIGNQSIQSMMSQSSISKSKSQGKSKEANLSVHGMARGALQRLVNIRLLPPKGTCFTATEGTEVVISPKKSSLDIESVWKEVPAAFLYPDCAHSLLYLRAWLPESKEGGSPPPKAVEWRKENLTSPLCPIYIVLMFAEGHGKVITMPGHRMARVVDVVVEILQAKKVNRDSLIKKLVGVEYGDPDSEPCRQCALAKQGVSGTTRFSDPD